MYLQKIELLDRKEQQRTLSISKKVDREKLKHEYLKWLKMEEM